MRSALSDLVHRYAAAVDSKQPVSPLFAPDGVLVTPDPPNVLDPVHEHVGHSAIDEAMQALAAIPRTIHAIVGEVYDGDTGRIVCVAHHLLDERTDLVWHLRYLDRYVEQDGWKLARRELHLDLIETRTVKRARLT